MKSSQNLENTPPTHILRSMCQLAVWICCIVVLEGFEGKFGVRVGQGGVAAGVHGQALGKGRMPWAHTLRTGTQHTMTKGAVILIPVWYAVNRVMGLLIQA